MTSSSYCLQEKGNNSSSPYGAVRDDERVCRGAFGPTMHYDKSNKLKVALVRAKHLFSSQLSVWRIDMPEPPFGMEGAMAELRRTCPPAQELHGTCSPTAGQIRSATIKSYSGRVFCVIDDCRIDDQGGAHPSHAVIGVCCELNPSDLNDCDPIYEEIKNKLLLIFRDSHQRL